MYKLTLVTPEKALLTKVDIEDIIIPGNKGEMQILEGHSPLVTTLTTGVIEYKKSGETKYEKAIVSWGFVEITPTEVIVMAETLETAEEINKERAKLAFTKSEKMLSSTELNITTTQKYQRKLQRAQLRKEI